MKAKFLLTSLAAIALAGPSHAALIAGWDFSQYSNLGFVSLDGATLTNTLVANHSGLDPTNQQGVESNQHGVMHIDGQHGSFNTPLDFADPLYPEIDNGGTGGSLLSNASQAFLGFGSAAACTNASVESMPDNNCSDFLMRTTEAVSVVFEALPGAANPLQYADTWSVSFGAKQLSGAGAASILVEFSPDGSSYATYGTANLTGNDTAYTFSLAAGLSQKGYVRLTFSAGPESAIDNVGIAATPRLVPEPGTAILLGAGLLGLARAGRRSA